MAKATKKSTNIDMTAMCDVAFLLLTFFMLATKFKPAEPVEVVTPSSVSSRIIPDKDVLLVTIDKTGGVYFQIDNPVKKLQMIKILDEAMKLNLSAIQIKTFTNSASIGVSFAQLKPLLNLTIEDPEAAKEFVQTGIPADSANNELVNWLNAALKAYKGQKLNLLIKGDNATRYPAFKFVLDAFKKNEQNKFLLVTKEENVPVGSPLWKTNNQ